MSALAPVAPGETLRAFGVVPVVAVDDADQALRLGATLLAAGLGIVEVTFRTPAAAGAIAALTAGLPELVVGAGTLLAPDDVARAVDAGAAFGVAPGLSDPVVEAAAATGLPFVPGVATPSELERAAAHGLDTLKLFPAEAVGGTALIDALAGPYPRTSFMPTGGVRPENLAAYLSRPSVVACGGTWIAPAALLSAGDFDEVGRRAARAVADVATVRPGS